MSAEALQEDYHQAFKDALAQVEDQLRGAKRDLHKMKVSRIGHEMLQANHR
jgi:hypothetical protein